MRNAFLALVVAAGIWTGIAAPAKADNYPYCLTGAEMGGGFSCMYSTFQQCQASASGRSAYCVESPFLSREPRPSQQPTRRRHTGY